jgi:hypothetical protein
MFYLVVLGAAIAFLTGCSGSTTGTGTTTKTPPADSVTVTGPALAQNGIKAGFYAGKVTVTNPNGSDVSSSCSSSSANLATIDNPATCAFTPSATNAGDVTITATANADTSKTASFVVHVGNYALLENNTYGLQMANIGSASPLVTLLHNNLPLQHAVWFPDHLKIAGSDLSVADAVINVYTTDGTAGGTVRDHAIDLTTLAKIPQLVTLAVSPDGTKIAFVTEEGSGVEGIYTVNATADAQGNTAAPALLYKMPANGMLMVSGIRFDPKGKQLLFENVATQTVWAMNVDGSNFHQLINAPSVIAMYSPDMSYIYYSNYSGGAFSAGVWSTYVSKASDESVQKTLPGYFLVGVAPNGVSILLSDGTSIYTADASGANISSAPIGLGGAAAW